MKLTREEAAEKMANQIREDIDLCEALQVVFDHEYDFYVEQPADDIIEAFEDMFEGKTLELTNEY